MSSAVIEKLTGLMPDAENSSLAQGTDAQLAVRWEDSVIITDTALTTTNAVSVRIRYRVKQKCRCTGLWVLPTAALTAHADDNATLTVHKRAAADYTTAVALSTYATNTVTTDDMVAFTPKDIGPASSYAAADTSVFDLTAGDVITITLAKANSGVTWPISSLQMQFEPRD